MSMDINNFTQQAYVSATISAIDGIVQKILPEVGESAGLTTVADMYYKLLNRIDVGSVTVVSGGSVAAVAIAVPSTVGASCIVGRMQGVAFTINHEGLSGDPGASAVTTSNTVRKVLVTLGLSAIGDGNVFSSFDATAGSVGFVYGSAVVTEVDAASNGGVSSIFNAVPLPKGSAHEVPIGWLNIPNSYLVSAGIDATMMITDQRATQGLDLSAIRAGLQQP